jgi:hypothetical protein
VTVNLTGLGSGFNINFIRGNKFFELSNHLGNVLATVSDKKTGIFSGSVFDHYEADIVSSQEYYPFGMQMPRRGLSSSKYRYGFNGQERSDEIAGEGNHNTAEFWEYDTRIGRRWNLDSVIKLWLSGYTVLSNNPIVQVDPNGADDYFNADGTFIRRTKEGTNIRIMTNNGTKLLSELSMKDAGNIKAVVKIVGHYSPMAGIPGGILVGVGPNSSSKEALASTSTRGIIVHGKGNIASTMDDYRSFINVLAHEEFHRENGDAKSGDAYTYGEHLKVYEQQMDHKSFLETSDSYKQGVLGSYAKYLAEAFNANEIDGDKLDSKIGDMNKKFKKYGIKMSATMWSGGLEITVERKDAKGVTSEIKIGTKEAQTTPY